MAEEPRVNEVVETVSLHHGEPRVGKPVVEVPGQPRGAADCVKTTDGYVSPPPKQTTAAMGTEFALVVAHDYSC